MKNYFLVIEVITTEKMLRIVCLVLFLVALASGAPTPDTSETCTSCEKHIEELDLKWNTEDGIEKTIADLTAQCQKKHKWLDKIKKDICEKLVEKVAAIPEAIFKGMDSLAWNIPEATCAMVKKCNINCCDDSNLPEQIKLSLSSHDRTNMGVSWTTLESQAGGSQVVYGTDATNLNMESKLAEEVTYNSAGWIGVQYRAMMTSLEPCSTYYYQVGSKSNEKMSDVYHFNTYCPSQSITFAVIADMGFGNNSDSTIKQLTDLVDQNKIHGVIHSGDIGYADGYQAHWDTFLNKIQPITTRIPYMVTPGNHEFWFNFKAYKTRFYMPSVGSNVDIGDSSEKEGSGDNMYYSWSYGPAHFVAMNSETAIDTQDFHKDNLKFVEADMAAVDRTQTPWMIAHFHRPLYCANDKQCTGYVGASDPTKPNKLTKEAEDLFYNNKVDVVMSGDVHEYERTFPVYKSEKQTEAPVYILQGASGNREGNKGSFPDADKLPDWSASHSMDIGYGLMTFTGTDTLDWQFIRAEDNTVLDTMTMKK